MWSPCAAGERVGDGGNICSQLLAISLRPNCFKISPNFDKKVRNSTQPKLRIKLRETLAQAKPPACLPARAIRPAAGRTARYMCMHMHMHMYDMCMHMHMHMCMWKYENFRSDPSSSQPTGGL